MLLLINYHLIMKKTVLCCVGFLCSLTMSLAQGSVEDDLLKAAGSFYVYDYNETQVLTPTPEGYKPFYISHFARHGARYCTSEYGRLFDWLTKAADAEKLSDYGREFLSRYEPFYQHVEHCSGNLTGVGKAQHRAIARHMYERFPEVFDGNTHIEAVSTESPRVIMSMWSYLSQMVALDEDIDINADASARYAPWLQPTLSTSPYYIKGLMNPGRRADEAVRKYYDNVVPCKEIVEKFFVSMDVLEKDLKITPEKFISTLHGVVCGTRCLDEFQGCFDDVFTPEQLSKVWQGASARFFLEVASYEGSTALMYDYAAFTLGQIIEAADADIASGKTQLRLRFGHDSGLSPLLAFMNINGFGRSTASFDEAVEIFPNYSVPMGSSLQLIFYSNGSGDVLVKALHNEREAVLPFEAVQGPYYRWSDFKAHYAQKISSSRKKIEETSRKQRQLAVSLQAGLHTLKAFDWEWDNVGRSKVEAAGATINVFGGAQTISIVRFPIDVYSVSIVSSVGAEAMVTSAFGNEYKALAAINGSYFDGKLMPTTYVKDDGEVVSERISDGIYRSNAMIRIKDKKGHHIDIVPVPDSSTTVKSAKDCYEAVVSGPILIDQGVSVKYENTPSTLKSVFYGNRHPRTLVGYTTDGWVYLVVVDGRFPGKAEGMSIFELRTLAEALGLFEAVNLDGGGSSALWNRQDGVINHPSDNKTFDHKGQRRVPNAIIVR